MPDLVTIFTILWILVLIVLTFLGVAIWRRLNDRDR